MAIDWREPAPNLSSYRPASVLLPLPTPTRGGRRRFTWAGSRSRARVRGRLRFAWAGHPKNSKLYFGLRGAGRSIENGMARCGSTIAAGPIGIKKSAGASLPSISCESNRCAEFAWMPAASRRATIADHVREHGGNWNAFWLGDLQSQCAATLTNCTGISQTSASTAIRVPHGIPSPALGRLN